MPSLPIDDVLPALINQLNTKSQLILKAPPGAGKSTRLPLVLLQQGIIAGKIIMLEPRRLAARNIANYLASQLSENVGDTIGLRVRGETRVSSRTKLEIVTEGVMTRMLQQDPELTGIDLLIFDEFHERSLDADLSLALTLEVQEALRDDLKVLVMSATLDAEALINLLPQAGYVESEGRSYPVELRYKRLTEKANFIGAVAKEIVTLLSRESGSMLVFLPGAGEIRRLAEQLDSQLESEVLVCPLYGQLTGVQQQQAITVAPKGKRKVVLTTNIAETSLTIEGIRMVVDCGLERIALWDPKSGINRLESVRIARSSAEQRAGRAGRLEAGVCLRLYSEDMLERQPATPQPEILRADLTSLFMELVQWGCQSASDLHWLDLPPTPSLKKAQVLLEMLGAVDASGKLTEMGMAIQKLGVAPRHATMLLLAQQHGGSVATTAAILVALLEDPPRGINNPDLHFQLSLIESGKLPRNKTYLKRAKQLLDRLGTIAESLEIANEWVAPVLAAGFPDRIALSRGKDSRYQLANGQGAMMMPNEPLADEELLVVADIVKTRQGDSRIFSAVPAQLENLQQILPHLFMWRESLDWDDKKGRLLAEKHLCCGKLVMEYQSMGEPDPSKASEALLNAVIRKGLTVLPWSKTAQGLLVRARCAAEWLPEMGLPAMDDETLLSEASEWLLPYMNGMKTLKALERLDLVEALGARLGWDKKQKLDKALPTHHMVPTGSRYAIRYQENSNPVLAVKLQEMFGEKSSPLIANGKVPIVLELLSPAQRPLQITSDLAAFWEGAYCEVRKEMKGRYPKHPWPENPASHIPTKKIKKYM
ncbi:ATP-dependent helicase HrpB [Vibrio crassostreae]|uniref:ATP-dependent helicase HrpB n=1 Tax=Vibrio crassostreae TaxID=246167 RepID=UPI00200A6999|nr:ATP-dependent helicase HrpB [Vibrio crassostreae]UPR29123.1 ATP-dependent helicase HrpB [Vibrio crassostreae]CAH7001968.1 RNA-dependent NTPase HrpB [Vibrio chagasii]